MLSRLTFERFARDGESFDLDRGSEFHYGCAQTRIQHVGKSNMFEFAVE